MHLHRDGRVIQRQLEHHRPGLGVEAEDPIFVGPRGVQHAVAPGHAVRRTAADALQHRPRRRRRLPGEPEDLVDAAFLDEALRGVRPLRALGGDHDRVRAIQTVGDRHGSRVGIGQGARAARDPTLHEPATGVGPQQRAVRGEGQIIGDDDALSGSEAAEHRAGARIHLRDGAAEEVGHPQLSLCVDRHAVGASGEPGAP